MQLYAINIDPVLVVVVFLYDVLDCMLNRCNVIMNVNEIFGHLNTSDIPCR